MRTERILLAIVFVFLSCPVAAQSKRVKSPPPPPATEASSFGESKAQPALLPEGRRISNLKWNAFMDLEARLPSKDTLADRGVTLNDAALYLTKDFSPAGRALIELPFQSDLSGTKSISFAETRAQAFFEVERWRPIAARVGQYNSPVGMEANDSRERFFCDWGLIKQILLPKTHTGVQMGYRSIGNPLTMAGQIAAPNGSPVLGQNNPELAINGRYDTGIGYGSTFISMNDPKSSATSNKTNMLIDIGGGFAQEKFRIDAEIDFVKNQNTDKSGSAFGILGVYVLDEALSVGGRLESLRDVYLTLPNNSAGVADSIFAFTGGPSYRLQADLAIRADLTLASYKAAGFDETIVALSLSLVADL